MYDITFPTKELKINFKTVKSIMDISIHLFASKKKEMFPLNHT